MKHSDGLVFVVDDDPSVRSAMANLIESVGLKPECFASAQEFLQRHSPDSPACIVLDVRMPGLSGLDLQRQLSERGQHMPIVFATAYGDIAMAVAAIKAGAVEFLPKPFREQDLLNAIRDGLARDHAARTRYADFETTRERFDQLTPREHEVLERIMQGKLNKQIAADLDVCETTIKVHRRRVMNKMGASTLADLVLMVERIR